MDIKKLDSKSVIKLNKSEWEKMKIHEMNPDVNLIKCQKALFPAGKNKKLLYIGFGEGQNLPYLISQEFKVYGTEIAKSRLDFAKKIIKKNKQKAFLQLVDSNKLPFKDNFFDIIIAWQSLSYNNKKTLKESLDEIKRTLKPGGCFLSSMISLRQKLLCHKKIGPGVYRPAKSTGQSNCILYCFKNEKQIKNIYKDFKNIKIGFYSSYLFKSHNFHYVIACEKSKK